MLCIVCKMSSCTRVVHFSRGRGGNQDLNYRNCFQVVGNTLLLQQYLTVLAQYALITLVFIAFDCAQQSQSIPCMLLETHV